MARRQVPRLAVAVLALAFACCPHFGGAQPKVVRSSPTQEDFRGAQSQAHQMTDLYPWASNYAEQGEEILDRLRESMWVDVKDDVLPSSLLAALRQQRAHLLNMEGQAFAASIQQKALPEAPFTPSIRDPREQWRTLSSLEAIMQPFAGTCIIHASDYWNYEWCPSKEVRQFHATENDPGAEKEPENSPGDAEEAADVPPHPDQPRSSSGLKSTPVLDPVRGRVTMIKREPEYSLGVYKKVRTPFFGLIFVRRCRVYEYV